jgi:cytochrome c biogenesis protein CcmG, thiol:disulfide interchange protein DsbE
LKILIKIFLYLLIISVSYSNDIELKIGDQAPPIYLFKIEDNKYFKSKDLLGKKNLIVSFFATWCVPCAKEIPELTKLSKQFGDDFHFLLVDVNEKKNIVKEHISKKGITLQVVLDKYGKTFEKFGGTTLPLLVVIDKRGNISYKHTGYVSGDEKQLKKHLLTL